MDVRLDPLIPLRYAVLVCVLAGAALVWCGWRSSQGAGLRRRLAMAALRLLAGLLATALVLNPGRMERSEPPGGRPVVALCVDCSGSMAVADCGGRQRLESALAAAREMARGLPETCQAEFMAFDAQARAIEPGGLEALTASGTGTDLAAAVEGALDRFGRSLDAAVLLTDGIHVGSGDPLAAARRARAARTALMPVVFGGPVEPPDISVSAPGGRRVAFAGQNLQIMVELRGRNIAPRTVPVEILEGDRPLAARSENLASGEVRRFAFTLQAGAPGFYTYRLRAGTCPGETDKANNLQTFGVVVLAGKIRVLFLEGSPSWDSKFLVQTLRADPNVELRSVFRLAADRFFCTDGSGSGGSESAVVPDRMDTLEAYDVVVLGKDVEYFVKPEQVALLRSFVSERGGALVLARGKSYSGQFPELAELEPLAWSEPMGGELRLEPSEMGRALAVFQTDARGESAEALSKLPMLTGAHRAERIKPFCDVLAWARPVASGTGGPDDRLPALVTDRFGMGTVCLVNAEGLWKWSFLPPAKKELAAAYPHFWGQLLRWVASRSDYLPGQDFSFRVSEASVLPGQPFRFTVATRLRRAALYAPRIRLERPGKAALELAPGASADEPGVWNAICALEEPGEYRAVLDNNVGQPKLMEMPITVRARRGEADELSADRDLPARMAALSDGLAGDAPRVLEAVRARLQRRAAEREERSTRFVSLWDRAALLLLVVLTASAEWALRRRGGLL